MSDYICHDFKTPRMDTSKRLPNSFKAIPILFYISLVGGAYFMTMDWLAYKKAKKTKEDAEVVTKDYEAKSKTLGEEVAELIIESSKAEGVARWIEGARGVQPLLVSIARAMPAEVRISDLSLERNEQVPSNLGLTVRINGGSASEVGLMETSLARLQYRSYSPQQSKDGDVIEYRSTLVRQD